MPRLAPMRHLAPICCLTCSLLAGCHWLLGHTPSSADSRDRGPQPERPLADLPQVAPEVALLESGARERDAPQNDTRSPDGPGHDGPKHDSKIDLDGPKHDGPKHDSKIVLDSPKQDSKIDLDGPKHDLYKHDSPKPDSPKLDSKIDLDGPKSDALRRVWLASSEGGFTIAHTKTWTHTSTLGGCTNNGLLVVGIAHLNSVTGGSTVNGGGNAFDLGKASAKTELFYLASPSLPITITVTLANAMSGKAVAGSALFRNVSTSATAIDKWYSKESRATGSWSMGTTYPPGFALVDVVQAASASITPTPWDHQIIWSDSPGSQSVAMAWKNYSSSGFGWDSSPAASSLSLTYGVLTLAP